MLKYFYDSANGLGNIIAPTPENLDEHLKNDMLYHASYENNSQEVFDLILFLERLFTTQSSATAFGIVIIPVAVSISTDRKPILVMKPWSSPSSQNSPTRSGRSVCSDKPANKLPSNLDAPRPIAKPGTVDNARTTDGDRPSWSSIR